MNDEKDEMAEKPELVEEIGLLDGHKIVKSPRLLPAIPGLDEWADDE